MLQYMVELLLSIISTVAYVVLMYTLFRIPLIRNHKQIALISTVVGLLNFYLKTVVDSPYFLLAQIGTTTLLLLVLRSYPILYAFLVCMTGFLGVAVIEGIITYGAIYLDLTTTEKISDNLLHNTIMRLAVACLDVLAAYLLSQKKIGFVFVVRRFSGKGFLKTHNFIWVALLCLAIIVMQFGAIGFDWISLHGLILTLITLLFFMTITHAYQQNKRVAKDRYGGTLRG